MRVDTNDVSCRPFSKDAFIEQVHTASRTPAGTGPCTQVAFLAQHLEAHGAKALVVERHYIDRHFMEEFSLYYSRCFTALPHHCVRIHVFTQEVDDESLSRELESAAQNQIEDVTRRFEKAYVGYVVVRPLASAPIGRTILKPLSDKKDRRFPATVNSHIHFLGTELCVSALAFQQQDRAVAACATTAIWSALQRACRADGARQPTPSAITQAGVRHSIPHGRPLPSSGLTIEQMCEAFRQFDYPPEVFHVGLSPLDFLLTMYTYLRSGIPVVIALVGDNSGHAVTAVGYRSTAPPKVAFAGSQVRMYNLGFDQLYMHDDRLGPYARARVLLPSTCPMEVGSGATVSDPLQLEIPWPDGAVEQLPIYLGVAPLYPKVRLSGSELLETAGLLLPYVQRLFIKSGADLGIELFLDRSGSYTSSLYKNGLNPKRVAQFQRTVSLSRYVAVIRWYVGDKVLLDAIWDTTDRLRVEHEFDQLLALVGFSADPGVTAALAQKIGVPWC